MPRYLDVSAGMTFGRWTTIERAPSQKNSRGVRWKCTCECGRPFVILASRLLSGHSPGCRSCGKEKNGKPRADGPDHRTRSIWYNMLRRCDDPQHPSFERYGARGISVCDEWKVFCRFFSDMGRAPRGRTLDRIDNDGNYIPQNCQWSDRCQQTKNRSSTVHRDRLCGGHRQALLGSRQWCDGWRWLGRPGGCHARRRGKFNPGA